MTYDSWKLDNAEDEYAARIRAKRIICADCDMRFATVCLEDFTGYRGSDEYVCEACADRRQQDDER